MFLVSVAPSKLAEKILFVSDFRSSLIGAVSILHFRVITSTRSTISLRADRVLFYLYTYTRYSESLIIYCYRIMSARLFSINIYYIQRIIRISTSVIYYSPFVPSTKCSKPVGV